MLLLFRASSAGSLCDTPTTSFSLWRGLVESNRRKVSRVKTCGAKTRDSIRSTHRKAHVSELLDKTVHDPSLIGLAAHLSLTTEKTNVIFFFFFAMTLFFMTCYDNQLSVCCCLTLLGPFLGPLPQELQEEPLSWEVGLLHMSPSSASHWPVDMLISSPPFPQLSCIGLGPTEGIKWSHKQRVNLDISTSLTVHFFGYLWKILNGRNERVESMYISMWPLGGTVVI